MYHTIFFDLDGTLTDSSEGIFKCFHYALDCMHAPPLPQGEEFQIIGPPLEDSFARLCGFSPEDCVKALGFFRQRYRTEGCREVKIVPGMRKALETLRAAGLRLAVASSKEERGCHLVLEALGIHDCFDCISGHNVTLASTKEAVIRAAMEQMGLPDASGVLMVGDRKYDADGAAAVGMDCLGVDFCGFAPAGELEAHGVLAVVHTAQEMTEYILAHSQKI